MCTKKLLKNLQKLLLFFLITLISTLYISTYNLELKFSRAQAQETAEALLEQALDKTLVLDNEGTLEALTEAIKLQPNFAEAYYQRGRFLLEHLNGGLQNSISLNDEEFDKVLWDFTYAIIFHRDYEEAYYYRALLYAQHELQQKAISDLTEVIRINSTSANAYLIRGKLLYDLGDYQNAANDFETVTQLYPEFAEAYYWSGLSLGELCKYEEAVSNFVQVIRLDPEQRAFREDNELAIANWRDLFNKSAEGTHLYYRAIADFYAPNSFIKLGLSTAQGGTNEREDFLETASSILADELTYVDYFQGRKTYGEEAIAEFTEALKKKPAFAEALFLRGLERDPLHAIGALEKPYIDAQKAFEDYSLAIVLKPELSEAYYHRGLLNFTFKNDSEARRDFIHALEFDIHLEIYLESDYQPYSNYEMNLVTGLIDELSVRPTTADEYYHWARVRELLGDIEGAVSDYSQAIKLSPDFAAAYYHRNLIVSRNTYGGGCDVATKDFSKAIVVNPSFAEAYYQRGLLQYKTAGYDYLETQFLEFLPSTIRQCQLSAIDDLTKAISLNPELVEAYYVRGLAYNWLELNPSQAIQDFIQMLRLNPEIFNRDYLDFQGEPGVTNETVEELTFKVEEATRVLFEDSHNVDARLSRAFSLIKLGEFQQANKDFEGILHLETNDADVYYGYGWTKYRLQEYDKAILALDQAIQLSPTFVDALILRALVKYDFQDTEGVLEDTIAALRLDNDRANAFFIRSLALKDSGNVEDSRKAYDIAMSMWPCIVCAGGSGLESNPEIYFNRAVSLSRRGDKRGAIRNFQFAANLFQRIGDVVRYRESLNRVTELRYSGRP